MELTSSRLCIVVCVPLLLLLGVSSASDNSVYTCRSDQYYNRQRDACVPCSMCGADKPMALRACYKDKDTRCGQWRFQFPYGKSAAADEKDEKQTATPMLVAADETGDLWFIITMVLIAILVLLCATVMILLFVWCFVCKRKQREMVIDPVFTNTLLRLEGQGPAQQGTTWNIEQFKLITET